MALLKQAAAGSNPRGAALRVVFLRNTLARVPDYRKSVNQVKTPTAFVSDPFLTFLKLPTPSSEAAAPDLSLRFDSAPLTGAPANPVSWIGTIPLDDQGKASVIWADASNVQIAGGPAFRFPGAKAILGADLNYDFRTDLIFAGAGGVAMFEQKDLNHFADITQKTHLPADILKGSYTGAWAFDVDLDGDLDIVLGAGEGEPIVLRNNGDETFAVIRPFPGVNGITAFGSADIDGDGDPDVAMLDKQGHLHVFANERLGQYRPWPLPQGFGGRFLALTAADIDSDGMPDFDSFLRQGCREHSKGRCGRLPVAGCGLRQ
jgi:hypothetical protein